MFDVDSYLADRQRCRTDLLFLCQTFLHYPDVDQTVHGPIIEKLQHFDGGTDEISTEGGKLRLLGYVPKTDLWKLSGPRKRLFLDPRGHLKTTVITISHGIQWILNYPDIRILISTATGELSPRIIKEMRDHFRFNEHLRFLFPDYCPQSHKASEWGNSEEFTVPNRKVNRKEPTVSLCTVGKVIAGGHYEVIKHSDVVDKENVKTPHQIQEVVDHVRYMEPLLERSTEAPFHGWVDMEGTPYDFSDVYNTKLEQIKQDEEREEKSEWQCHVRSAEVESEDKLTLWPQKFPWSELKSIQREMGDLFYSAQYCCNPVPGKGGLCSEKDIQWIPQAKVKELLPSLRLHTTIDLAGMEDNTRNDRTVINTTGFDRDGRPIVCDVRLGHFDPFEVIELMFTVDKALHPIDFKIEKDAHARILLPFLRREMEKRKRYLLIVPIQRDNRTSKKQRIRGLQPWFKAKFVKINGDLECRLDIVNEIVRFTEVSRWHDDFLDTLADQMQNRDGGVSYDVMPDAEREKPKSKWEGDKFLGFEPKTGRPLWVFGPQDNWGEEHPNYHRGTGL